MNAIAMTSKTARTNESVVAGEFEMTNRDFQHIAAMLYEDAGIDLPQSKAMLVYSRLAKRLRALQINSFQEYCTFLTQKSGIDERRKMLSALTTNVTSYFRERHHFDHLRDVALPRLIESARKGGKIRLWSAGCSTGQEPYSIALMILGLEPKAASLDIRILATDIDAQVIDFANQGIYEDLALKNVPPELKKKYFAQVTSDGGLSWKIMDEPRKLISFRELNLNANWPMKGTFDVIFCRNVVIYFSEQTQQAIWSNYSKKMTPGGWLYIGHSERVTGPAASDFHNAGITTYQFTAGLRQ